MQNQLARWQNSGRGPKLQRANFCTLIRGSQWKGEEIENRAHPSGETNPLWRPRKNRFIPLFRIDVIGGRSQAELKELVDAIHCAMLADALPACGRHCTSAARYRRPLSGPGRGLMA